MKFLLNLKWRWWIGVVRERGRVGERVYEGVISQSCCKIWKVNKRIGSLKVSSKEGSSDLEMFPKGRIEKKIPIPTSQGADVING
ncbi:hypothetical protein KFK09_013339 [Dendrobium nobile]|uniref:Uncharacterized protein n=1 Tax=Dendrobium nobile TaxID=94219 RepID=A0A8T3B756_DENNO|nr:hypothetical protein KFK09_013339 [Dendrobium nobile]